METNVKKTDLGSLVVALMGALAALAILALALVASNWETIQTMKSPFADNEVVERHITYQALELDRETLLSDASGLSTDMGQVWEIKGISSAQ